MSGVINMRPPQYPPIAHTVLKRLNAENLKNLIASSFRSGNQDCHKEDFTLYDTKLHIKAVATFLGSKSALGSGQCLNENVSAFFAQQLSLNKPSGDPHGLWYVVDPDALKIIRSALTKNPEEIFTFPVGQSGIYILYITDFLTGKNGVIVGVRQDFFKIGHIEQYAETHLNRGRTSNGVSVAYYQCEKCGTQFAKDYPFAVAPCIACGEKTKILTSAKKIASAKTLLTQEKKVVTVENEELVNEYKQKLTSKIEEYTKKLHDANSGLLTRESREKIEKHINDAGIFYSSLDGRSDKSKCMGKGKIDKSLLVRVGIFLSSQVRSEYVDPEKLVPKNIISLGEDIIELTELVGRKVLEINEEETKRNLVCNYDYMLDEVDKINKNQVPEDIKSLTMKDVSTVVDNLMGLQWLTGNQLVRYKFLSQKIMRMLDEIESDFEITDDHWAYLYKTLKIGYERVLKKA